ncbi:hypothetical protein ERJ75_000532900 [Trypanosoma vivax]|nr:hypothetical protein ERJ75_000532900 [Trypanosoma vivax]
MKLLSFCGHYSHEQLAADACVEQTLPPFCSHDGDRCGIVSLQFVQCCARQFGVYGLGLRLQLRGSIEVQCGAGTTAVEAIVANELCRALVSQ